MTAPPTTDKKNTPGDGANEERRPIPQPTKLPFIGNLADIDPVNFTASLDHIAARYGPIFQLTLVDPIVFIGSQKLVHYVCNEDKFEKKLSKPLVEVREFAGDGLFTAFAGEHNWNIAHRVLVPAFGPIAIKKMQPMMLEIISQMLMFWEHHAGEPFEAADQFTRLTFDTIGWCAFRYRFNSFHTEKVHPFINCMVKLLAEAQARSRRPGVVQSLMWTNEAEFRANIAELHEQCDEIVAERRSNPDPEARDLLNNMINDKDPKTGEMLSDENIRFQMVTFLIAGHETTSGMLSFVTYYLLKNPHTLTKAREEADRVVNAAGGNLLKINAADCKYIDAVCKEALRLQPSAPAWSVTPKSEKGETLPGGYYVPKGQGIVSVLTVLHRDPEAWGNDAEEFRPERWLEEKQPPPDAWKPFGNGSRACIGRGFAIQEAILTIALMLNRFDLSMVNPSYNLEIKQTLTIKPHDFFIRARPRKDRHQSLLSELLGSSSGTVAKEDKAAPKPAAAASGAGQKIHVFYGSNSGSCQGLALEIAAEGAERGYKVDVKELDAGAGDGRLPTDAPVVICTASYEGKPTDNARNFVESITNRLSKGDLAGVKYAVMGAGHRDWASTFHRIPKLIDQKLTELGAERYMPLSLGDAGGDLVGDFDLFKENLFKHFDKEFGNSIVPTAGKAAAGENAGAAADKATPSVKILPPSANAAGGTIKVGLEGIGTVMAQEIMGEPTPTRPQTNYITIKLPDGQTYRSGDYLAVLPNNPLPAVQRALKKYGLRPEDNIVLSLGASFLPKNTPLRAGDLFSSYVELGVPVSRRILPALAEFCKEPKDAEYIRSLEADYSTLVTDARLSLLDVIDMTESCSPPLEFFLANLPKMKIRQYSISSTPLADPNTVTLTFTVHTNQKKSGGRALGVASNYLAFLSPGDKLLCSVKESSEFHLPLDPATPVVLFAAGSGVAPFHGFIAERSLQRKAGRDVGSTTLFYGFRDEGDMLHRDNFAEWVRDGTLDFRPVISHHVPEKLVGFDGTNVHLVPDAHHAQDRVWAEREDMKKLFEKGAEFYTCGSGARLGAGIRGALVRIIGEAVGEKDAEATYERLARDRYKTDVFL